MTAIIKAERKIKMFTKEIFKKKIWVPLAVAFLLFTRYIYCFVELGTPNSVLFIAECAFITVIYGVIIYDAPAAIQFALSVAGCLALCVTYALSPERLRGDVFYPVTYLSVFLFLIENRITKKDKTSELIAQICKWLLCLCSVILLVSVLFNRTTNAFSLEPFIICFFAVPALLYVIVAVLKLKLKKQEESTKQNPQDNRHLDLSFFIAAVSIMCSCFFLLTKNNIYLNNTLPLLWIVNLLILIKHPELSLQQILKNSKNR